ncbi:MAG: hypothetical protein IBGAMO2_490001 [Arenicellales bacterium IbO2]|nr:MAG: hypothetical protein IBGAMO2_490001 [Arenicellales bacterium IbO2]
MKNISLIGVDCASKKRAKTIGLALGWCDGDTVHIKDACAGMKWDDVTEKLSGWIKAAKVALLALDAPLGWPVAFRSNIRCHKAGKPLRHALDDAEKLFYRQTDLEMITSYKKYPLAVGANFIARTAHAALGLLGEVRGKTDESIRLAWTPGAPEKIQAIEVYPAATLIAHFGKGVAKETEQKKLQKVAGKVSLSAAIKEKILYEKDGQDVFDAVLCVLAAADFVKGDVIRPTNRGLAKKEGWIWVKSPQSDAR